jgi:protein phosphatase
MFAGPPVFVVADGVGGNAGGEVASELTVVELARLAGSADVTPDFVLAAIGRANDAIVARAGEAGALRGMGTTLVGLVLVRKDGEPYWMVVNVGDSRAYRLHRGKLDRITVDHSVVQDLINRGELTEADARTHPRRHVVTRVLGTDPAPQVDCWLRSPVPGERFLLCSDGLSEELDEDEIRVVLDCGAEPAAVAAELTRLAVASGGRDNVTVVVVDLQAETADGGADTTDTSGHDDGDPADTADMPHGSHDWRRPTGTVA